MNKTLQIITCFFFLLKGVVAISQTNTPCNSGVLQAPNIPVGSSCSNTNGTTVGSASNTNAANGGTPTCGSMGEDVWYSFTAPASGSISIQTQSGSITDGVMAVYSGSCGAWTEVACDDDGGVGTMPQLDLTGLVPGTTYLIRFWEYGGGTGTFSLCVTETIVAPPPTNVTCLQMNPICTNSGLTFPAQSGNNNIDPGNNYDCLFSQPNPTWYYLKIATPGILNMSLTAGSDVDFILYGPYNSLATAQNDCGTMGAPSAEVVDCSFSFASTENPTIANAQVGEVYVLLITNYADVEQNISLTASGTATTDCAIVSPCTISSLTATPSTCNSATNTYSVSGTMTFSDDPTTGQLIIESCEGVQAVYNCPIADPFNYTISNIPAGGGACDVTAYFTADPSCTATLAYTAPSCSTPCFLSAINVNVSSCQPDNTFNLTGSVSFTNAPSTGVLTVTDCNGHSATYNAPFVSPLNWAINNLQSDGTTNCSVTATFSAATSCTITTPVYDNPAPCACGAIAGTYSTTITGSSQQNYVLCYGDQIDLLSNNDFVLPAIANNPPGPVYDPTMGWLVYTCPPTIGLTPSATEDLINDPCLLGIMYGSDYSDINDLGWMINYPGQFTNNTVYFVPLTVYSQTDAVYSYVNTGLPCFATGAPIAVQYLPEITSVVNQSCITNDVTIQLTGGLPALNGSSFTVVTGSVTPSNAVLSTTTISNNGILTITGLNNGDAFSLDIQDNNGCPINISGVFTGIENANFTYPKINYCANETDPQATLTGVPGGTFTGTAGLVINASTGLIDLSASTAGAHTITYTTPGPSCIGTHTVNININVLPSITTAPSVSVCVGANATLTAFGGVNYAWNNGAGSGNNIVVSPISTTIFTVSGTDANGCVNTAPMTVTVNPLPVVNAGLDQVICLGQTVVLNASGATTYTWNNNVVNNVPFSPVITSTYTVSGTDANGCVDLDDVLVSVSVLTTVSAGIDISVCDGQTVVLTGSGANSYTWNNGVQDGVTFVPPVGNNIYVVTGTSLQGCTQNDTVLVIVNPIPQINFVADTLKGCVNDIITLTNLTANASSCVWTISNGLTINDCGPIAVQFDNEGVFDVSLTVSNTGNCSNTLIKTSYIEIIRNPIADFSASNFIVSNFDTQILFTNQSDFANTYVWTFGDESQASTEVNPLHEFPQDIGDYIVTLRAYNQFGCVDSIIRVVKVFEELIYYVPNTFTPDNDEYNPTFQPIFTAGFNPFDYTLLIFDRWGEIVFESHNAEIGWEGRYGVDGKICQDGTYTWKIEFKTNQSDERKVLVGHVNLIR